MEQSNEDIIDKEINNIRKLLDKIDDKKALFLLIMESIEELKRREDDKSSVNFLQLSQTALLQYANNMVKIENELA